LVYRNQIGVDHRYAEAGKWKEEYIGTEDSMELIGLSELKRDQMKLVHFKGKRIVIGNTETGYVAFDDRCSHRGASLADGVLICGTVQCPWHGSQFDVKTGQMKAGPAKENIRTFIIENRDNKFYLKVD
jgi:nitrite reductase/ring-hydroxylating ferredoxin subunit